MDNSGVSHKPPFAADWGRGRFNGSRWLSNPELLNRTRRVLRRVVSRYAHRSAMVH